MTRHCLSCRCPPQEFCEVGSLRVALENHMLQGPDGQPNLVSRNRA